MSKSLRSSRAGGDWNPPDRSGTGGLSYKRTAVNRCSAVYRYVDHQNPGFICRFQIFPYLCINIDLLDGNLLKQASGPNWMSVFFFHFPNSNRGEVLIEEVRCSQSSSNKSMYKGTNRPGIIRITTRVEVVKLVKVRSYKRIRNGKVERVRSHYRKY